MYKRQVNDILKIRGSQQDTFRAPNLITINESMVVRNNTRNDAATEIIQPHISEELFHAFHEKYHDSSITTGDSFWENGSGIKFNKYNVGDYLSPHHDHIRDFFEGQFRGIPVTSVIGTLNDDYEGGEFVFWGDYKVEIKKGSVLAFPSIYLFPHEVKPVTKGVRYSWISWIV